MFFDLEIDPFYLGDRRGISSIMVGTLIKLLKLSLSPGDGVPLALASIISSAETHTTINLTTSKVPAFGLDYQDPVYGYQALGVLLQFPPLLESPSSTFQYTCKITAVHDAGHPTTSQFQKNYVEMEVDLTKHFIIIFIETAHKPIKSP